MNGCRGWSWWAWWLARLGFDRPPPLTEDKARVALGAASKRLYWETKNATNAARKIIVELNKLEKSLRQ